MSQFHVHTSETAPEASQASLAKAQKKFGNIPNLIGALAEAPIAAEAYLTLSELANRSSFTPTQRHVVWFTLNAYHNCEYCMAAHSAIAKSEKIDPRVVETARHVESYEDEQLEALRVFTWEVADGRGWVQPDAVDRFLSAGYTRQNVLEVVTILAHKVMSNYTNHLVETPLDEAFQPFAWAKPVTTSS